MSANPKRNSSGMPEMREFSWQRRRDYLVLVASVAASDGLLHPDELALLEKWMAEFNLSEKSREAVLAVAKEGPVAPGRLERRLAGTNLTYSLLLDMMGMAMSDGVLMDDEVDLLREVAEGLRVDPIEFQILMEFVHSAHQAAQLSNPEPLFEHNIERAFDLLRQRKVVLFSHTLLCPSSPEYDRRLKQRWQHGQAKSA